MISPFTWHSVLDWVPGFSSPLVTEFIVYYVMKFVFESKKEIYSNILFTPKNYMLTEYDPR